MFLGKLENLLLLRPEMEGDKGTLVAVTDVQTGEEPFDVIEFERQGRTPTGFVSERGN